MTRNLYCGADWRTLTVEPSGLIKFSFEEFFGESKSAL